LSAVDMSDWRAVFGKFSVSPGFRKRGTFKLLANKIRYKAQDLRLKTNFCAPCGSSVPAEDQLS
jgi:hypothetical protein